MGLLVTDDGRLADVTRLLRDGATHEQIAGWADRQGYRGVSGLIERAEAKIQAASRVNLDLEAGRAISRLNDLYARFHEDGDYKGCLQVQAQHSKILGLDRPDRNVAIRRSVVAVMEIAIKHIPADRHDEFIAEVTSWFAKAKA